MIDNPARALWQTLETLHDVVYFAPQARDTGLALGLRGYWMTYFAFRAAPLGPIGPEPVTAMFAGFDPAMVAKALPDAWSRATPQRCVEARVGLSVAALRELDVDAAACAQAAALLGPAVDHGDPTGRPLFAANQALPRYDDPVAALWQTTTALREHRGDGHVAALVSAGLSGLEAHHLQVAKGAFPEALIRGARGWSDDAWHDAAERLSARGLIAEGSLTEAGRGVLAEVEARTDQAAWAGALSLLGSHVIAQVCDLLAPAVAAVRSTGWIPDISPTGLPPH
jgi:hypothetical protein